MKKVIRKGVDYDLKYGGERWRLIEEIENVGGHGKVFAGEIISKAYAKRLVDAGIFTKDGEGNYVLTGDGRLLWSIWNRIKMGDT